MADQCERSEPHPRTRWRIVLADDHELIREGIAAVIAREPELSICGLADNEKSTMDLVARHRPELLLIDLSICRRDGLSLLRDLLTAYPATRVLALAAYAEELYAKRVLSSGASGYLIKSVSGAELVHAIRIVARGEVYTSARLGSLGENAGGPNNARRNVV